MKRKQLILFVLTVIILVGLNNFLMRVNNNLFIEKSHDMINHDRVSSQKLFDSTWQIIRDNFYDPTLNHQVWSKWKNHYHGKIKTEDDAKVAINSMLASLDDPYSKYMSKDEYAEQNTSISSKITGIVSCCTGVISTKFIASIPRKTSLSKLNSSNLIVYQIFHCREDSETFRERLNPSTPTRSCNRQNPPHRRHIRPPPSQNGSAPNFRCGDHSP